MRASPPTSEAITLDVKVVPGASRDRIVGWLGTALKTAVSRPAESGQANQAVCRLIASELKLPVSSVAIVRGLTQPRKTIRLVGIRRENLDRLLPPRS